MSIYDKKLNYILLKLNFFFYNDLSKQDFKMKWEINFYAHNDYLL